MSTTDQMTIDEIYKYLRKMRPMYQKASKKEKGKLLDEMETITGRHRKYICTLLKGQPAQVKCRLLVSAVLSFVRMH